MDNQELLQALQKMIQAENAQLREEINKKISKIEDDLGSVKDDLSGVKVLLDLDIKKNINLLGEGQQVIIDRLPNPDELEAMEARLSAVEVVMRKHSKEIQELKKAQ